MASPGVLPVLTPHSSGGFYARNNPFQQEGPVGFVEQIPLPNNEVYVRIDLPGVEEDLLTYAVDKDKKKLVLVVGRAIGSQFEDAPRLYSAAFGLACDCCEISGVEAQLRDGVLRMLLKKDNMKKSHPAASSICDHHHIPVVFKGSPSGPTSGTCSEENPYVVEGPKQAYETKDMEGGGLFVRVDMPGMVEDDLDVFMENGEVRFMGTTSASKLGGALDAHDSGPRRYLGAVCPFPPINPIKGKVACEVRNGVLKMIIRAPS